MPFTSLPVSLALHWCLFIYGNKMNLSLLILIPVLTAIAVLFCNGIKQVRTVALFGSAVQVVLVAMLLFAYWIERSTGNTAQMLFESRFTWFAPLNIEYY